MAQHYKYITKEMFAALKPGDQLYCHSQLNMRNELIAAKVGELYPIKSNPHLMGNGEYQINFSSLLFHKHILTSKVVNEWFGWPVSEAEALGIKH